MTSTVPWPACEVVEVAAARHGERRVELHARVALAVRGEAVEWVSVRVAVGPAPGWLVAAGAGVVP